MSLPDADAPFLLEQHYRSLESPHWHLEFGREYDHRLARPRTNQCAQPVRELWDLFG